MQILRNDWYDILKEEFKKEYYINLINFLKDEYKHNIIYPDKDDIFNALNYTEYKNVKVVILGQDPYHGPNQAHGLSFSVKHGVTIPPSLVNIYKELKSDLGFSIPNNGYLKKWSDNGVLLLNTVLTVEDNQPNSHQKIGWTIFTDKIIEILNNRDKSVVFIMWGKNAQNKINIITNPNHYVIKSVHPSPLSAHRGFFGSKPFSKANTFLESIGESKIDWQIQNI